MTKNDNQPIQIIDRLFIGSISAASNKDSLLFHNISHIVIAGLGLKKNFPDDFTYIHFDLLDYPDEDIKQYFREAGEFINNAISMNKNVLVHW